jgi:hypothetical protein
LQLLLPAGGSDPTASIVLYGPAGWLIEGNDRGTTGSAQLSGGRWVGWTPPCATLGGSYAPPVPSSPKDMVAACTMGGFASPLPRHHPKRAAIESTWLYISTDAGKTFRAGPELAPRYAYVDVLASPSPRAILIGKERKGKPAVELSTNSGRTWTVVYRGTFDYVAFATASDGAALVQGPDGSAELVVSHDGGRHWAAARL